VERAGVPLRREELARVHDARRVDALLDRAQHRHPERAVLGLEPRSVVAAHRMVVGERAARGEDRIGRRRLRPPPLRGAVVLAPRQHREVQRGARRVEVRHVAPDERRRRGQRGSQGGSHRLADALQRRPRRGGLERLGQHPAVEQVVAQVWAGEPGGRPRGARSRPGGHQPGAAQDGGRAAAATRDRLAAALPAEDEQAARRRGPQPRAQVRAPREPASAGEGDSAGEPAAAGEAASAGAPSPADEGAATGEPAAAGEPTAAGEGEREPGLVLVGEPRHVRSRPGADERAQRGEAGREARGEPALVAARLGQRVHAQRHLGEHAEHPLRAGQQLP